MKTKKIKLNSKRENWTLGLRSLQGSISNLNFCKLFTHNYGWRFGSSSPKKCRQNTSCSRRWGCWQRISWRKPESQIKLISLNCHQESSEFETSGYFYYLRSNPGFPVRLLGTWPVRLLFCKKLKRYIKHKSDHW